ncbi:MAG TPA: MBL fold metallo-hydrolase, partial [Candidatus Limnocylindria bacterium]|nr:MBL fold metallo-hydrolase [Candidatus Limnocylindria bacterium]
DPATSTLTYVVHDAATGVVIDAVLDYDPKSARTSTKSAEAVARYIDERRLSLPYVIDTHAHADHLTAMPYFKKRYGARTVTGSRMGIVQRAFRDVYNLGADFPVDGRQFDLLLDEGQELEVGSFRVRAMHTPGHTPAHMSWCIGDALFVGDSLFMPDYGTARCDFPGGSAEQLFDSIQRIYALPESTRLFMCHDYQPGGRELRFVTTVAEQKRANIQLREGTTKQEYVRIRKERDATLDMPALILPAVQVNIRAGAFPEPEANGTAYLKIPLNAF